MTVDTATAPAPPILQRPAPPRPAPPRPAPPRPAPPVLERPAPPRPPPPPPARPAPKKKHHGVLGSVLHVVESVAEVAAPIAATAFTGPAGGAAVMAAEGALKAAHATGGAVAVAANPVWLQLASVLGEVTDGFRISGTPLRSDQQTFLRVVDHLSQLVNGLALAPDDPELHAEFHENHRLPRRASGQRSARWFRSEPSGDRAAGRAGDERLALSVRTRRDISRHELGGHTGTHWCLLRPCRSSLRTTR